jgi:hypothetical protein
MPFCFLLALNTKMSKQSAFLLIEIDVIRSSPFKVGKNFAQKISFSSLLSVPVTERSRSAVSR